MPTSGYIYIIKLREFIVYDVPVYKIGKTRDIIRRVRQYPKNSKLVQCNYTNDMHRAEKKMIAKFKKQFKQRKDIGTEYFEGDLDAMMTTAFLVAATAQNQVRVSRKGLEYMARPTETQTQTQDDESDTDTSTEDTESHEDSTLDDALDQHNETTPRSSHPTYISPDIPRLPSFAAGSHFARQWQPLHHTCSRLLCGGLI